MITTVSAPGKLYLLGEHAVVYGKPAIIAAVNRRCTVTLYTSLRTSSQTGEAIPTVKGKSKGIASSPSAPRNDGVNNKDYINFCLQQAFSFFKKHYDSKSLSASWRINLKTEIPLGSGMGSSAAVAVAIAGAVSKLLTGRIVKGQINKIAFKCEKLIHGNPSGGDNTACTYGGLIWYQRKNHEGNNFKILQLSLVIPENISSKFFIINTGQPEETTKEMVKKIKDERLKIKDKVDKIFNQQERLTYQLAKVLEQGDESQIKEIIRQGEQNLEILGVVSELTKRLIRKIEVAGGAAKICGAGGAKGASGIVLVFHNAFDEVERIAEQFKLKCEKIRLGEEGIKASSS